MHVEELFFFSTELFCTAENAPSQGEMEGTENQGKQKKSRPGDNPLKKKNIVH